MTSVQLDCQWGGSQRILRGSRLNLNLELYLGSWLVSENEILYLEPRENRLYCDDLLCWSGKDLQTDSQILDVHSQTKLCFVLETAAGTTVFTKNRVGHKINFIRSYIK